MECPTWVVDHPFLDLGMFVGCIVVRDGVNYLSSRNGSLHGIQELDEFLVGVLGYAAADHRSVQDIEGGKQGGGPIALVVVGHGAALAGLQRQPRLGAIRSLDLAFLVDGHDDGVSGRVHIEAHDILDLGDEVRVLGLLEGAQAMRLEIVSLQIRWTALRLMPTALATMQPGITRRESRAEWPRYRAWGRRSWFKTLQSTRDSATLVC